MTSSVRILSKQGFWALFHDFANFTSVFFFSGHLNFQFYPHPLSNLLESIDPLLPCSALSISRPSSPLSCACLGPAAGCSEPVIGAAARGAAPGAPQECAARPSQEPRRPTAAGTLPTARLLLPERRRRRCHPAAASCYPPSRALLSLDTPLHLVLPCRPLGPTSCRLQAIALAGAPPSACCRHAAGASARPMQEPGKDSRTDAAADCVAVSCGVCTQVDYL